MKIRRQLHLLAMLSIGISAVIACFGILLPVQDSLGIDAFATRTLDYVGGDNGIIVAFGLFVAAAVLLEALGGLSNIFASRSTEEAPKRRVLG